VKNLLLAIIIKLIILVLLALDMIRTWWWRWREKRKKPQKKLGWYAVWDWGIIEEGYVLVEDRKESERERRSR